MFKYLKIFLIVCISLIPGMAFSQGEIDDQPKVLLKNEKSAAVFLTSNGIGAGLRYGARINARNQTVYDLDFMNVKHPKEFKQTNAYNYYSSRSFVFGKQNNFFELKGSIGKQYEMFRKNDKGGLSIRYYYSAGPTVGILKPIYYEIRTYSTPTNPNPAFETEKFNTSIHQSNIYGRASFFKGLNEISLIPGGSAKAGFSFEYSRESAVIHAIDVGIGIDIFPKAIPIMATETNNFFFFNLNAGYRFGKIVDVSEAALARNRKQRRQDQKLSREISREQKKNEKSDLQNY